MYIAIPSDSQQNLGGGFTFRRNLIQGLKEKSHIICDINVADVVLFTSTSMITKETYEYVKSLGTPLVVRIDNVPRNSRNRNTGTSRLKNYSLGASAIVYQSEWARRYLSDFIGRDGKVIYNGVDTKVFKPDGSKLGFDGKPTYLFSQYNRDETKRWDEAWYKYQLIQKENPDAQLVLVGNFSPELSEYNFDFFRGEKVKYMGIIDDQEAMAQIYRSCDYFLATYFNDCYSNTYQEFIACGGKLYEPNMSGGTPELIANGVITIDKMTDEYVNVFKEVIQNG